MLVRDCVPGFADELLKLANAATRAIGRFYSAGNVGAANRIAKTPGVLKPAIAGTPAGLGSQIKHLGTGMEGASTLVAHPEHGVAVRKVYDPKGISGPALVQRKAEAGQALRGNPDFAQYLGEAPSRIGPAHFYEHVPGGPNLAAGTPASDPAAIATRARGAESSIGMKLHDMHEGNVIGNKVVDYIPYKPGSPTGLNLNVMDQAEHAQNSIAKGVPHPYTNYIRDPRRPGNLMARASRGAPPLVPGSSPTYLPKPEVPQNPTATVNYRKP